jgi:hypothetical protein
MIPGLTREHNVLLRRSFWDVPSELYYGDRGYAHWRGIVKLASLARTLKSQILESHLIHLAQALARPVQAQFYPFKFWKHCRVIPARNDTGFVVRSDSVELFARKPCFRPPFIGVATTRSSSNSPVQMQDMLKEFFAIICTSSEYK